MKKIFSYSSFILVLFLVSSASMLATEKANIIISEFIYSSGDTDMNGYVAYDGKIKGKRPAIIVVHEWWGSNDYVRMRARMLASLGYIAMVVDLYGNGELADNPQDAMRLATPFYSNPQLAYDRLQAAYDKLLSFPETDSERMAAIGYCFGGSMVLNAAKMGMNFKSVVSFHGGLSGVPPTIGMCKASVLVCHGLDDKFVSAEEVAKFKSEMDAAAIPYKFIGYKGSTHAFTNPASTENGIKFQMPVAYNEAADKKSWKDMKSFFKKNF